MTLVIVRDQLVDDDLREHLILGDGVQHARKCTNQCHKGSSTLEDGMHCMLRPLRVLRKSLQINHGLSAELSDCFLKLWMEDVEQEVIEEGRQCAHGNVCG